MSGEKRCQVSGSRAVSRKACQDSEMTSASQIERKWHHQKRAERKKCQGEKDVQTNRQQHERLSSEMKQAGSRENGSVRQGCRQNRKVKKKEPQELAQSTARTARRQACPGSTCVYVMWIALTILCISDFCFNGFNSCHTKLRLPFT